MRGNARRTVTNVGRMDRLLTKQQKNALDYWKNSTRQLEKTTRSVLDVFRRNNDSHNYTKYEIQYKDFKGMRGVLSKDVERAIQSKNLQYMEKVIAHAVKILKDTIQLNRNTTENKTMSNEYDDAVLAVTKCMAELRKKLQIVDKCLSRLSAEMTLYSALGKELKNLLKSTLKAKAENRENIASTVIQLAPEVLTYIRTP